MSADARAADVEAQLVALYGTSELLRHGVGHITSARRMPDNRLHVISIGAHAPESATDFFILNYCRARADAILTSAGNMRSEPELAHNMQGPHADALTAYRRDALGKKTPQVVAILTSTGELPLVHPVWADGTTKLVFTNDDKRAALQTTLGARARVVGFDHLDVRAAVAWLQREGHGLVSIEAGPRTVGPLYEGEPLVDELLLSLYEEPRDVQVGGTLPAALFAQREMTSESEREEVSGAWRFQRWSKRSPATIA